MALMAMRKVYTCDNKNMTTLSARGQGMPKAAREAQWLGQTALHYYEARAKKQPISRLSDS
jgi:hypothetical protein